MGDQTDVFAAAESRQRRLFEELAAAPLSDVSGVVALRGAGGGRSRSDQLWTMSFTLDAWRLVGTTVDTRPLTVRRKVTDQELKTFQDRLVPYSVIHVKARVVIDSSFGSPQALLETILGEVSSDAELNRQAEELQKPVTFEDSILGTFTLDRRVNWFTGQAVWDGESVTLQLSQSAEVQAALTTAHALWKNQRDWNRRVRDFAVEKLLPLKNNNWLDEDEAELTPIEFENRMRLESITVNPDGSFDFWHDDGDLFWGHSIQVSGNLAEGPTHADIPG